MPAKFALIIPTLNAGKRWCKVIDAIKLQETCPDSILVVDSGSVDQTPDLARNAGFDVIEISADDYDHGGTRQLALEQFQDYEIVMYLTQDAIPGDSHAFTRLLKALTNDSSVGAVTGRQLPDADATVFASHSREYNYTAQSLLRSRDDIAMLGIKTVFMSNSFAAYNRKVLESVGGFPQHIIFGEDMYVAARMLKAGWKIGYAADACVYHSHNYSMLQEFKRYFDMGVFQAREPWIKKEYGRAEKEGVKFVLSEFKYLLRHAFWRIPEGILRTMMRYAGFRLGRVERHIPLKIKRKICMNPGYFKIQ